MATVGLAPTRSYIFRMRQKATRMPYSCQLQFGRSGSCGAPCGGVITVRAIGRDRSQSSSDSTGHTTSRMPSGRRNGGRCGSGVKAIRSRGCMRGAPLGDSVFPLPTLQWEREKRRPQLPGTPWMAGKNMSCHFAGRVLRLPTVAMNSAYFMTFSGDVV